MKKIKSYLVKNIPLDLYQKLYSLNLRNEGAMRFDLVMSREDYNDHDFIVAVLEDDVLLGWALVECNTYEARDKLQIYVRRSARRQGIGSRIIKHVKKRVNLNPRVFHSHAEEFFNKNKMRASI